MAEDVEADSLQPEATGLAFECTERSFRMPLAAESRVDGDVVDVRDPASGSFLDREPQHPDGFAVRADDGEQAVVGGVESTGKQPIERSARARERVALQPLAGFHFFRGVVGNDGIAPRQEFRFGHGA